MMVDGEIAEAFWARVKKTDTCWEWSGSFHTHGTPLLQVARKRYSALRVSLALTGKEVPPKVMVDRTCGNRSCVNPDHLLFGNENRFYSKIQKLSEKNGGCWVWTGNLNDDMYGYLYIFKDGKTTYIGAHVYAWELFIGRPVPKGVHVCHTCDHPYCVNPHHLFIGTNSDNIKDKVSKGRQPSKLKPQQVIAMREDRQQGMTYQTIADKYGVKLTTAWEACKGKMWSHLPMGQPGTETHTEAQGENTAGDGNTCQDE